MAPTFPTFADRISAAIGCSIRPARAFGKKANTDIETIVRTAIEQQVLACRIAAPAILVGAARVGKNLELLCMVEDGQSAGYFDVIVTAEKTGRFLVEEWRIDAERRTVRGIATLKARMLHGEVPKVVIDLGQLPMPVRPLLPPGILPAIAADSPMRIGVGYLDDVRHTFDIMSRHTG